MISASSSGAQPAAGANLPRNGDLPKPEGAPRLVTPRISRETGMRGESCLVELAGTKRMALTITPASRGPFRGQLEEVQAILRSLLDNHGDPMSATVLTVFLRRARDRGQCERAFEAIFGLQGPVINYVFQPPCCGAALAIEAWAIGGEGVQVEHFGPRTLAVTYDGVRWIHCGVQAPDAGGGLYNQAIAGFGRLQSLLQRAGSGFEHVVRTWLYLGGITARTRQGFRYQELNAARADFYRSLNFRGPWLSEAGRLSRRGFNAAGASEPPRYPHEMASAAADAAARYGTVPYPASTGIGMTGRRLMLSCLAAETRRDDVFVLSLENPNQEPAYTYQSKYSNQSPKFSRATALVLGNYVTTWISGTASIVGSESCHPGDPEGQTQQTINNIERLISGENFAAHGYEGAGAGLRDLAKIRVYLKRAQDLAPCRQICERRFGPVPAIYAVADICRPELLVEIEGVAFSRYSGQHDRPSGVAQV